MDEYRAKYARSIEDPAAFWRDVASEFEWRGAPLATTGLKYNFDKTKGKVFSEWCVGAPQRAVFRARQMRFRAWSRSRVLLRYVKRYICFRGLRSRFKGSTTNLAYNALDKQIELGRGAQVAMFAERNGVGEASAHQPDQYTYSELRDEVDRPRGRGLARARALLPLAEARRRCATAHSAQ